MSASNVMEVITKGSFEVAEGKESRCSTSQSISAESQLSLEYLPPEAPYYGGNNLPQHHVPLSDDDIDTPSPIEEDRDTTTTLQVTRETQLVLSHPGQTTGNGGAAGVSAHELFNQIHKLSEKIHTQLGTLDDVESLDSHCSTPSGGGKNSSRQHEDGRNERGGHFVTGSVYSSMDGREQLNIDGNERESGSSRLSNVLSREENVSLSRDRRNQTQDAQSEVNLTSSNIDVGGSASCGGGVDESVRTGGSVKFGQDDPKIEKAMKKMRKLDEKLDSLVKKEREVKRQRRLLEQQMEGHTPEGSSNALVLFEDDISLPMSPLFPTQPNEGPIKRDEDCRHQRTVPVNVSGETTEVEGSTAEEEEEGGTKSHSSSTTTGTDFIRRNIELAAEAGALVAMTETERKRLDQLLSDDTQVEDPYSQQEPLSITDGDGFAYSDHDLERMRNIDSRLQMLLPANDWESICSSSRNTTPSMMSAVQQDELAAKTLSVHSELEQTGSELGCDGDLFDQTSGGSTLTSQSPDACIDTVRQVVPGEEVLHQFQMTREEKDRLRDIDARLKAIQAENERVLNALVPLPVPHLQMLLDQYTKEQGIGRVDSDPLHRSSSITGHVEERTECDIDLVDGVV